MSAHSVTKGLDLPIAGAPTQSIATARAATRVALLPADTPSLRPRLLVQVGDAVRPGQPVYQDRKHEAIRIVSPIAGRVTAVTRGDRRVVLSVEIEADAPGGSPPDGSASPFASWSASAGTDGAAVRALLLESGLWTALRTRPFSHVPLPDATPQALFVTAMDSNPLAPDVEVIVADGADDFARGLSALRSLCEAPLFVCRRAGSRLGDGVAGVTTADFSGKHPAGTVGYHMHVLAPVSRGRTAWHLGAQDVIRLGTLLRTGHLDASHVVALGGPLVKQPRLLRTTLGARVSDLIANELTVPVGSDAARVISGSVLSGRQVTDEVTGYLGRYHQQISVIPESSRSDFMGWTLPMSSSYTFLPVFLATWAKRRETAFDTRTHGGRRAMVPIGVFERVMPMDLMPTHLLRALTVGDTEWAEQLGALELDEEDLALCSFVCPGKYEYGTALRRVLDQIASEL